MIGRYIVRRLGVAFLQLVFISLLVFFLMRLLPADPAARLVGLVASEEAYAKAQADLGLDQPILVQLATYAGFMPAREHGLLQGDMGTSWISGEPVAEEILTFLPITVELLFYSFALGILVSIPVGMVCAVRPGSLADRGAFLYGLFAGSQPEFWWGLFFIFIFYDRLGIAPAPLGRLGPLATMPPKVTGFVTFDALLAGDIDTFVRALHHLLLPVLALNLVISGPLIKMIRQNMVTVLHSEFILHARACGLRDRTVAVYALRNVFAPAMTTVGILFAFLLGGAVLVEKVFSWGGLGEYTIRSVLEFDFPAIQGVVTVIAGISLLVYLLLDIAHAVLDPRVTLE